MTSPNQVFQGEPLDVAESNFAPNLPNRYKLDGVLKFAAWSAVVIALAVLIILLADVAIDGLSKVSWQFLTNYPSRRPAGAGILSPLVGTVWVMLMVAIFAFPIGVGAGIFLEEFVTDSFFENIIEVNIANLAAVPSIIYGLLGLQVFVRWLFPLTQGRTIIAGALTLTLLILPIIIISTREALRSVPGSMRQAGFALGATRWQVVREIIFPQALPGILTGTILALSRAIGETAPLITIGALTYVAFLPPLSLAGLQSTFAVLPIQIFNWVSRPQQEFHLLAAGGIIVLMVMLLLMNGVAIYLRNRFQVSR